MKEWEPDFKDKAQREELLKLPKDDFDILKRQMGKGNPLGLDVGDEIRYIEVAYSRSSLVLARELNLPVWRPPTGTIQYLLQGQEGA